jgi:2-hydroxychromene-2-carboxylate isomerase
MARIDATLYTDAACPWGYSALPALRVLEWRYGDQLAWRLVLIGLTEQPEEYLERGYTTTMLSRGWIGFRRHGMPFAPVPKSRVAATGRGCRAVVAARLRVPGSEWRVLRQLQLANFTTDLLLDDDAMIEAALCDVPGIDAHALVAALDDADVEAAYQADRAESRTAAGTPTELQGKSANFDGQVRYTAPSVVFTAGEQRLEAGGFQPVEAYDVLIANLAPDLDRRGVPDDPMDLFDAFPEGLLTGEVAALLTRGNDAVDRDAAERTLVELAGEGRVTRRPVGDGALWLPA